MVVDKEEWLQAVLDHPVTEDIDFTVAAAVLVRGNANGLTHRGSGGLIDQADVDDSVCVLEELGFLQSMVSFTDEGGSDDHLLVLCMPAGRTL